MNDTLTRCPYCAEDIKPEAIKCKHCGSWLTGSPDVPPTVAGAHGLSTARQLLRSEKDHYIFGVCGGLAHYLNIDPTIVRALVAVTTFFTAIIPGIVIYLLLAAIVPLDSSPPK